VDYGEEEKLILLAVIRTDDGYEYDVHAEGYEDLGFEIVKKYDPVKDYAELKNLIRENHEGFVLKFEDGLRIKVKGEEYVRLHRLLTNFSNVDIWELLKDGMDLDGFLEKVPDEFDSWVRTWVMDLVVRFQNIEKDYKQYFEDISKRVGTEDRKAFAEEAKRYNHSSILFTMLNGRDYGSYIWKIIRPQYQKPFWNSEV
jgi:RNA ligase